MTEHTETAGEPALSQTPRTDAEIKKALNLNEDDLTHYMTMTGALNQWARTLEVENAGLRANLNSLVNMLILCGEDEAVSQQTPADKLRTIIDKNIELRAKLEDALNINRTLEADYGNACTREEELRAQLAQATAWIEDDITP